MIGRGHYRNTGVFIEIAPTPLQSRAPLSTLTRHQLRQLFAGFWVDNTNATETAMPSITLKNEIFGPFFWRAFCLSLWWWFMQFSPINIIGRKNFCSCLSFKVKPFGKAPDVGFYDFCTRLRYPVIDH